MQPVFLILYMYFSISSPHNIKVFNETIKSIKVFNEIIKSIGRNKFSED